MSTPLIRGFEVVIGIETHAQLCTKSKIFSGASTAFGAAPNTQACAVDLALPGTLPVLNRSAVERAIQFGLAVGAKIAPVSIFARKNYFYPDLPKGYQISQYEVPVVQGGSLTCWVDEQPLTINLTRAHLEEDAGKLLHERYAASSGVDLNRAGTPLLEIVTEPDMRTSTQAVAYARALHALVVWLGICDGNMQEGSFRCDANVSVRRPGSPLGTRREIKNLNSFKFMQQAINYEVQWQIDLIEDGGAVQQATVLFDPASGQTKAMRSKEDAHDYRYFPDPDLPPLSIEPAWIARVREHLPELPQVRAARYASEYGLSNEDTHQLTQTRAIGDYFEAAVKAGAPAKLAANWLMGEIARRLNADEIDIQQSPVSTVQLAVLMGCMSDGTVSSSGAKQVFEALWSEKDRFESAETFEKINQEIRAWIETKGLKQLNDSSELERLVDEVLARNPQSVEEYQSGKEKALNALVGQVMKASQGKANPGQLQGLLKKKILG
jgi:aspartyl-tRNA(Asn)/glutamyl-tRNA(Gln) amidotransferase subunit B